MVPKLISILAVISLAMVFPGGGSTTGAASTEDGIVIPSFDGEPIVGTLMLPDGASITSPVPVVLRTHGWGQRRLRAPDPLMQRLLDSGYALFTWDSRGFGHSGGEANWGAPDFEVRDASAIIDYLATRPEIAKELPGDPKLGWIGASNAGGVQLNTAAADDRVDAIVPQHSWGNLLSDLMPNDVYKEGWGNRLYARGLVGASEDGLEADNPAGPQEGDYAQQFHDAYESWNATGDLSQELKDWFRERSTTARSQQVTAPTLVVHGAIDTLFPLEGALTNYRKLLAADTPVKLLVYCSGHTLQGCPYPGGRSGYPGGSDQPPRWEDRIVSWLDRHLKGDATADVGPGFEWQAPDGRYYGAPAYPLPLTTSVRSAVSFRGLRGPGRSGGDGPGDAGPAPRVEMGVHADRARLLAPVKGPRPLVGTPRVILRSRLKGPRRGAVFLELVDVSPRGTRTTVNHQVMPFRIPRGRSKIRGSLHAVSWVVREGHSLELEITTGSALFRPTRRTYRIRVRAAVRLPVGHPRWVSRRART